MPSAGAAVRRCVVNSREKLEPLFGQHGFDDCRWFDPREIVVAQWVRMKCRFGCPDFGKVATCPPNTPSIPECEWFFREYREAAMLHFTGAVERPEERHAWTRSINDRLLKLERAVFLAGYHKAFVLYIDPCNLCSQCAGTVADCAAPRNARPAPEAMGVDVFTTARKCGYSIEVLSGLTETMDRFGLLLIE